jgi:drug/metabolite transporter (DMT)-like permease
MWLLMAIGASISFGIRGVFYHWAAKRAVNRNLMLFGVYLCGMIGSVALGLLNGQAWNAASMTGVLMGAFSFSANASLVKGFAGEKAAIVALLSGLAPVVVTILAYLLWHETFTGLQLVAFLIIMIAIVVTNWAPQSGQSIRIGLGMGLLAMFFFGFTDTTSAWSTRLGADVFPTLSMMFATGAACFGCWWLLERRAARSQASRGGARGWPIGKTLVFGMFVGLLNLVGMYLALNALHGGMAGLVSALLAMNIVVILLYIHFFAGNHLRRVEWFGVSLALVGIIILQLAE